MSQYIIPANSKKGQLIFNIFRGIDLGILGIGGVITLLALFIVPGQTVFMMFVKLLPISISVLLVFPIPNYHNVLVYLQELLIYFTSNRKYIWRGWCASSEYREEK